MKIIAETDELLDEIIRVEQDDNGLYHLFVNEDLTQPNHDANGIIRALVCHLQYY